MEIKVLNQLCSTEWDAFVESCPEATFFHRAGWREVIERAYRHDTHYLYAEEAGNIVGVLPLGHIRSRLFGNALISSPFCVYGGVAAITESARMALERAAVDLAREKGVDYLEFRNRHPRASGRTVKNLYFTFRKTLDPEPEKNLLAVPRKQRAMIRKGITAGLQGVIDDSLDEFYQAYSLSLRNLGTPVHSMRYFAILREVFGEACEILRVEHQGTTVAAVMNFYFRDEILPYYGGGPTLARNLHANDFMYWEVMRRAVEKGIRIFDYGRSKEGTGSYRFKTHWGFQPEPLPYEYELIKASSMPDVNPLNPKYCLFISAWRRLPLPVSQWLGPWLARQLG